MIELAFQTLPGRPGDTRAAERVSAELTISLTLCLALIREEALSGAACATDLLDATGAFGWIALLTQLDRSHLLCESLLLSERNARRELREGGAALVNTRSGSHGIIYRARGRNRSEDRRGDAIAKIKERGHVFVSASPFHKLLRRGAMSYHIKSWSRLFLASLAMGCLGAYALSARAQSITPAANADTATPIKHLIIITGENRGFDNVFATYVPPDPTQKVWNLLSQGIIDKSGKLVSTKAAQYKALDNTTFQLAPPKSGVFSSLPQPSTGLGAFPAPPCLLSTIATAVGKNPAHADFCSDSGLLLSDQYLLKEGGTSQLFYFSTELGSTSAVLTPELLSTQTSIPITITITPTPDCRYPKDLPSGPYPLIGGWTPQNCVVLNLGNGPPTTTTFQDNTGDPVHRFFQMWQQNDCSRAGMSLANPSGCQHDLYTWVATSVGWTVTKDGNPPNPSDLQATFQGGIPMGFYNMSAGEYPYFKSLAQTYSISDNYHQPVMGGTGANSQFMMTGDVYYYTDSTGAVKNPPENLIEDPDPVGGSNNFYKHAGFGPDAGNTSIGGLVNCSDISQPGVATIKNYLNSLPYKPFRDGNCDSGAFYQIDNEYPYYDHLGDVIKNGDEFSAGPDYAIGPQTIPTIGEALSAKNLPWKYYGEGFDQAANKALANIYYCAICNGFQYSRQIMTTALKQNLQDLPNFFDDVKNGVLPSVSFVKPDLLLDSHPGSSTPPLFEAFVRKIVETVKGQASLWRDTVILVTFDESGGYYDSGYIQPIDFFGDGPRTVMIAVSPYAKPGFVDHTYGDHASILKFIERNWKLSPLSSRSRDNLPNPVTLPLSPYFPQNSPAVGDLMNMFNFLSPPRL